MTIADFPQVYTDTYFQNPYPTLAHLRAHDPVHHTVSPLGQDIIVLTRYEDVSLALKDPRFNVKSPVPFIETQLPLPQFMMPLARLTLVPLVNNMIGQFFNSLLGIDDPEHARLRQLVHKAFTPRLVQQMRNRIQDVVNERLDAAEAKGSMEFISEFAFPIPVAIISDILGAPVEDRDKFNKWSNAIIGAVSNSNPRKTASSILELNRYISAMCADRRVNPRDDLVTSIVQAEVDGEKLTKNEILGLVSLLLIAGHETTTNLLGNGTLALLQHRDQWEMLRDDPALINTATEELIRFTNPVPNPVFRYPTEPIELRDGTLPEQVAVLPSLIAANRDPEVFENPDTLDITRSPNRHMGFGFGVHYCMGAPLARLEAEIAFTSLIERLPNLQLSVDPSELWFDPKMNVRGLTKLPVHW